MKVVLIQTAVGDYRKSFLEEVIKILGDSFHLYCGEEYFEASTITGVNFPEHMTIIRNVFLFRRKTLIQIGANTTALKADVTVLELNPRIITTWWVLIIRRLLRKNTVLWGHAWPRSGRGSSTDHLRNLMRKCASRLLVYTETQKRELAERMPRKTIIAAPNALYPATEMREVAVAELPTNFIYVGRLVAKKKPVLLLRAFASAKLKLSTDCKLVFVGDGPERTALEVIIREHDLNDSVELVGHVSDAAVLRKYYEKAIASVSPGYVGLSITQSFAFGVPMIIAKDEPHAPEIEAAVPGGNSLFFTSDSEDELAERLIEFAGNVSQWNGKRGELVANCRRKYSTEVMAQRFVDSATF